MNAGLETGVVHLGDCRELMAKIPEGVVDVIACDPPYGASDTHMRQQNINPETKIHNDGLREWEDLAPQFLNESARVLNRERSAFICFTDGGGPNVQFARFASVMADFLDFHCVVVWDKGVPGMGWRYRRSHEFVMIGKRKGSELKWHDTSGAVETVVSISRMLAKDEEHPTPKPVELMEYFLRLHTAPNDLVLDPFAGGGSTGVACKKMGRRFIGIEINPRWVDVANSRLTTAREQLRLFGG